MGGRGCLLEDKQGSVFLLEIERTEGGFLGGGLNRHTGTTRGFQRKGESPDSEEEKSEHKARADRKKGNGGEEGIIWKKGRR